MTTDTRDRLAALAGTRNHEDLPHGCRCGARWSGGNTCHCAACHRYLFVGAAAFDRHRKGGTCNSPADVGMVLAAGRAYDAWTIADTNEETP